MSRPPKSPPPRRSAAAARLVPLALLVSAALAALGVTALLAPAAHAYKKTDEKKIAELPANYQRWLGEVELIISEDELAAFLALDKDYQRDAFIDRFWRARDPYPDT